MNIQQLRAQIAALQDATMDENRNFRSGYDEGKFDALSAVDALLDSLQEESVSIWHDSNEEQPEEYKTVVIWNPSTMDGEVLTRCVEVYKGRIWAYIEDLLNLSNVQRTIKESLRRIDA